MTRRLISVPAVVSLLVAAPAVAQNYHWNGTVASGSVVSVSNISGNIRVVPSTSGRVDVTGIKRGSGRGIDIIRANVEQTSRGLRVCVLYDEQATTCDDRDGNYSHNSRNNRDWGNASMDLEVSV